MILNQYIVYNVAIIIVLEVMQRNHDSFINVMQRIHDSFINVMQRIHDSFINLIQPFYFVNNYFIDVFR